MGKHILFIAALLFSYVVQAGQQKILYMKSENCPPCIKMEKETWSDPEIQSLISNSYEFVRLQKEIELESLIIDSFGVFSFPTTIICNSDGEEVHRFVGFRSSEELSFELDLAKSNESSSALLERFNNGESGKDFIHNLLRTLDQGTLLHKELINEAFNRCNENAEFSQQDLALLVEEWFIFNKYEFAFEIESQAMQLMLDSISYVRTQTTDSIFDSKLQFYSYFSFLSAYDSLDYSAMRKAFKLYNSFPNQDLYLLYDATGETIGGVFNPYSKLYPNIVVSKTLGNKRVTSWSERNLFSLLYEEDPYTLIQMIEELALQSDWEGTSLYNVMHLWIQLSQEEDNPEFELLTAKLALKNQMPTLAAERLEKALQLSSEDQSIKIEIEELQSQLVD